MLGLGLEVTSSEYQQEFTITDVSDLSLWLQNGVGVTAAKWDDSSGNNNHVTQSTEANQGTVSGGGIDFEENDSVHYDFTSTIAIGENTGFCLAVVVDQETVSNNTILSKDISDQIQILNTNKIRFRANDSIDRTTTFQFAETPFSSGKMLIMLNRTAGVTNVFTLSKNGVELTPDTDTSVNEAAGENPFGFDINVLGSRAGNSQFFDGKILELAFWSKGLTRTEMLNVNNYLKSVHGL